jgi:carbon-monoxide dehydrogenase medium subunit
VSVLPRFALHRPRSLPEALDGVSPDDLPYVGGTELLIAMRQGLLKPRSLIDLKRVDGLAGVEVSADRIRIGAAVTHRQLAADQRAHDSLPVLRDVLSRVGNPRVQAAGTLVGNLCFAEPKSDIIPLLIALQATVTLAASGAERSTTVESFVLGPYATVRRPDELVTRISIPLMSGLEVAYLKYQIMERPTVGVAAARSQGRIRVVVGAVGPAPVVVDAADSRIDPDAIAASVDPMPDLTGSVEYKRHVTAVFVRRVLARLEGTDT